MLGMVKTKKKVISLSLSDIAILMVNTYQASNLKSIGYLDAEEPLYHLIARLNERVDLPEELVEKLFFSANLLDEQGQFWHPNKVEFKAFLTRLKTRTIFDRRLNMFVKPRKKKDKYGLQIKERKVELSYEPTGKVKK